MGGLWIVDRAAEALFAGRILKVFELFLGLVELLLHGFHLLLLLLLALVPLHTVGYAVGARVLNGVSKTGDLALQGSDAILRRQNLALPVFGRGRAGALVGFIGRARSLGFG